MLGVEKSTKLIFKKNVLSYLFISIIILYILQTIKSSLTSWEGLVLRKRVYQEFNITVSLNKANEVQFLPDEDDFDFGYENSSKEITDLDAKYLRLGKENSKPIRRLPDALVIGVKKCGTRALLEFLRIHPDIRAAGSEVHFFDKYYNKGINWYRKKMPPTLDNQVTMEKTPSYFVTKEVPHRVRDMNPNIKLLLVVRDPVTRAISDYTQAASKRSGAGSQEFERLVFVSGDRKVVDTGWGPIRLGLYSHYLQQWLMHFNLSQILFISGENLVTDPANQMALVQDFLGLKRVITEKHFYFNATKGFPCLLKSERRPVPHCLGRTKGRLHPSISSGVLKTLRTFYRPFNLRFYKMTGIDFGWL